jgi:signal transduction histidine kinase
MLWFMTRAMRNEQLAVQAQLTNVYTNQMAAVQRRVTRFWQERWAAIARVSTGPPAAAFATIVRSNLADAVVICDEKGRPAYPGSLFVAASDVAPDSESWVQARILEFQTQDFRTAANRYREIARQPLSAGIRASAILAQANCLAKAGERENAIATLLELTTDDSLGAAEESRSGLILPNAKLRLLTLLSDPADARFLAIFQRLVRRLNDYEDARLPAPQRRFLMGQVVDLVETRSIAIASHTDPTTMFATLAAERLAAEYLERAMTTPDGRLSKVPELADVWHARAAGGSFIALFREQRLASESASVIQSEFQVLEASIDLLPPGQTPTRHSPVPVWTAGDLLPGWTLALAFQGTSPLEVAARRQATAYLWTGLLLAAAMASLGFVIARYVSAQMRLVRLKDELVATVSHELKTPLASMRALVDTLLAGRCSSPDQASDYLRLIAKENQRLSHLIDNFLAFSRLEQGRQQFRFATINPETVAVDAVESLGPRLQWPACSFEMNLRKSLPAIHADPDALTTVFVNLLDNACKYSGEHKRIGFTVSAMGRSVCFEVSDNGTGLSKRDLRRVFERFYQVNQGLTRERSGCGLGLSIVQHIVRAHNGSIEVESTPAQGSVFRVRIPTARPLTGS